MPDKGKRERGKDEVATQFAAYQNFCDDTTKEKTHAIDDANEMIDMLKADVASTPMMQLL